MNKPKISIIVPVYNVEQYLAQCLDCLIGQTLKEIEIICVNDGSNDKSLDILKGYAVKDDRIIVLDKVNEGVSFARNLALKRVKGDFYMFLDSDDWLDSETCEVSLDYMIQTNADCLMFSYTKEFEGHNIVNHIFEQEYIVWNDDEVKRNFHRRLFGPIGKELTCPQDVDIIVSPCMQLFRTDKFSSIPFVDIRNIGTFEDGLYQMVVYKDCNRFVYIDKPFYHYRKTNVTSITFKYNPHLFDKWQHLYDQIENYIEVWHLGDTYRQALNNRIVFGVIGLGLNQVRSGDDIWNGGMHLNKMLQTPRYKKVMKTLDASRMPISWKVFFFLAKHRWSMCLYAMLQLIEYLRIHKKEI